MSGHGQREAALLVDAVNWKDRVIEDLRSEQGRLSAREHQVSVNVISEVAALIASYIASGEVLSRLTRSDEPYNPQRAADQRPAGETGGEVSRSPRACDLATRLHDGERPNFVVPY